MDLPEMSEQSHNDFVEEKFLELIKEARELGQISMGPNAVLKKMQSGVFGLVFLIGDYPYTRNIPVCRMCIDNGKYYHVFESGRDFRDLVDANCSVVMVENHPSYGELYELCKNALDELSNQ